MKQKLLTALKWAAYPAFYFFCLVLFGYLTFPFDRLKDRILAEISKQSKGKDPPQVTIEKLDSYWFSGVSLAGVKVKIPADDSPNKVSGFGSFGGAGFGSSGGKEEPEKDTVIEVPEAHARARLLPLLIGRVQLDFWASVFGGEVSGSAPAGSSKGDVDLEISDVKLLDIAPLQTLLDVPIDGKVNGELSLSPLDGKFSKASGKLALSIKNLAVGDGKAKLLGILAIPTAKVDEIVITGEAEKGVLKISKLGAAGPDIELEGDGKINVREPWAESSLDIYVKFKFTDAYRGKDTTTKSILGEPGSTSTPLIEMQAAKLKKAKRSDGFYGFHVHGKLKKLEFTPSATEVSSSGSRKAGKGGAGGDSPVVVPSVGKKTGGVSLPLGVSTAAAAREKERPKEPEEEKKEEPQDEANEKRSDNPAVPIPMPPGMRIPGRGELPDGPPPVLAAPPPPEPQPGEEKPEERPEEPPR